MAAMPFLYRGYWWVLLNKTQTNTVKLSYQLSREQTMINMHKNGISTKILRNHSILTFISYINRLYHLPIPVMISLLVFLDLAIKAFVDGEWHGLMVTSSACHSGSPRFKSISWSNFIIQWFFNYQLICLAWNSRVDVFHVSDLVEDRLKRC